MNQEKYCHACSMPLVNKDDFARGNESSDFCKHCVNEDGKVKSCDEIFNGGVKFFMKAVGADSQLAEKVTRKNMLNLPYWQGIDCEVLKGEIATDEEFAEALKKL
jgi:hypothetical protein